MKRDSFVFYRSFYEAVKEISIEEQLQAYNLIIEYALDGKEIEATGIPKAIFALVKPQIDANTKKYENGIKGGRKPKQNQNETKTKPKHNQNETKTEPNENENANVNVNPNSSKKEQEEKIHFAEFVSMTNTEHEKLVNTHGKDFVDQCILTLDNYKGSTGKKYKNDYRAILSWVVEKVKNKSQNSKKSAMEEFLNG